ncbi:MAG: AAA domain-containing protein [Chloroflexi bacterium]|nr:AAA domain-containing protein [Chloroflexota bacterium]
MNRFERFTERAQDAAQRALEILQRYNHTQIDTEHIMLALVEQPNGVVVDILQHLNVNVDDFANGIDHDLLNSPRSTSVYGGGAGQVFITPRVNRVFEDAYEEASKLGDEYISTEHIFLAILINRSTPSSKMLGHLGVDRDRVLRAIEAIRGGQRITDRQAEGRYQTLAKYSRDLTRMAAEGKLDPVIGRDSEILRVIQVLSRRTKNNPVLIGEAGVGKTAIVEGLAQKIVARDVPETLIDRRIIALDLGAMVAGARFRGEFEERLKAAMDEVQRSEGEIILFIDEIHQVVGAGAAQGAIDASDMMKPALARGELQTVGATTMDEYRQYIDKDSALERRFAPVFVEEPSVEETIQMLKGLKPRYEAHHNVTYAYKAIVAAAELSHRYVTERHLPDKAIDLLDEAAAKLRVALYSMPDELKEMRRNIERLSLQEEQASLAREYEMAAQIKTQRLQLESEYEAKRGDWLQENTLDEIVDEHDIAEVIENWTGIPVHQMLETEAEKLLRMEEALHERVIGQDQAIVAVSDAIRRARSGLKDPKRPIGSFIFLGSSGVGKTELAKTLAEFLFDDEDALLRIDMSEYREQHTTARLFGAPPGYVGYEEGGQLTEAVRRRPYRVILFDEIEKAHPEVWNSLLQILDDGRLTDGQGRTVDFRNTVIIMTSNLGTDFINKGGTLGFAPSSDAQTVANHDKIERALRDTFRPEFLNRIDEIIIFDPLTVEQVGEMVFMHMQGLADRLLEQGYLLAITHEARDWLARQGYDPAFGARPLKRAIQKHIESPLSTKLLRGDFEGCDSIEIDVDEDGIKFTPIILGNDYVSVLETD